MRELIAGRYDGYLTTCQAGEICADSGRAGAEEGKGEPDMYERRGGGCAGEEQGEGQIAYSREQARDERAAVDEPAFARRGLRYVQSRPMFVGQRSQRSSHDVHA